MQQSATRGHEELPLKPSPPSTQKSVRGVKISRPMPLDKKGEWKRQNDNELNTPTDLPMNGTAALFDNDVPMSEDGPSAMLRRPAVGYAKIGI